MINDYPYAELFREHNVKKDMIIVDRTAQITPVSDHDPTIVGTYIFTSEDIKVESFDLTENLCSEDNITFGLCTSSQVKITVKNKPEYPNLKDEVLKIYIYFNGDSDTLFEVGQYMVDTDAYSDDRRFRDLSMFDLLYFLRDYDITEWYNGIYADNNNQALKISVLVNDLMRWLSADENIPITYDTLPQINYTIPKNVTADNITFGFFLQPLLEVLGLFGHIDRTGKVVYKSLEWYDKPAVRTVTDDWRKPPTTWKDQYTWGIGQIDVYDENNICRFYYRNTDKKHPSIYTIADSFVFSSRKADDAEAKALLEYMWGKTTHIRYKPYEAKTIGDLCVEVGDRIDVQCGDTTFYTYVFERHLTGIQSMRDEYSARGNKKQPKHVIDKGSSYDDLNEGNSGIGTGGVSFVDSSFEEDFYEYIRNIGFRVLEKPSDVICEYDAENKEVNISWTDPSDISTNKPVTATWAGTVVVRRESSIIRHIWDGEPDITVIVDETTRDTYSQSYLTDSTVSENKQYYYAIFPYDTRGYYGKPVLIAVNTSKDVVAPTITDLTVDGISVTVDYSIPEIEGLYSYCKLVAKKGSIPTDVTDGTVINLNESLTETVVSGLDEESRYFFIIFTSDTDGNTARSEAKDCMTGGETVESLLESINGSGFDIFRQSDQFNYTVDGGWIVGQTPYYLRQFHECTVTTVTSIDREWKFSDFNNSDNWHRFCVHNGIENVYITTSEDGYSVTLPIISIPSSAPYWGGNMFVCGQGSTVFYRCGNGYFDQNGMAHDYGSYISYNVPPYTRSSLLEILRIVRAFVKNANIYVDGDLLSAGGQE